MLRSLLLLVLVSFGAAAAGPSSTVTIHTRDQRSVTFAVEIADTVRERERGLQHREELAVDLGMLLLYPCEANHKLWMKNTPIPLDMIFIGNDLNVAGIIEHAEPQSLESRSVPVPSRYVLEIVGGSASRHGMKPGDKVSFEGFEVGAGERC